MASARHRQPKSPDVKKSTRGRPSTYSPEICKHVREFLMYHEGAKEDELIAYLGIGRSAFYKWKSEHRELADAVRDGRKHAIVKLTVSLYERACGYSHDAEKIFCSDGLVTKADYVEHYPPDTAAATFLLRNWAPDKYKDKQSFEHTGADGGPIQTKQVEDLTADDLVKVAQERGLLPPSK